MGAYDWTELQTLMSDIAAARSRLSAARSTRNVGRARALEEEIAKAEARRDQLLTHITTNLVSVPEPAPQPKAAAGADPPPAATVVEEPARAEPEAEQPTPEPVGSVVVAEAAPPASAPQADSAEGGINVWNQLTPSDLERARNEIDTRRAEMLARHAEELKGLEADQAQLETLEQAIAGFLQKFTAPAATVGVVKLDEERGLRQQGAG